MVTRSGNAGTMPSVLGDTDERHGAFCRAAESQDCSATDIVDSRLLRVTTYDAILARQVSPTELHNMLKIAELTIKGKTSDVLMVQRKGMKRKGQPKPKAKKVVSSRPKAPTKQKVPKKGKCFHCGENGH